MKEIKCNTCNVKFKWKVHQKIPTCPNCKDSVFLGYIHIYPKAVNLGFFLTGIAIFVGCFVHSKALIDGLKLVFDGVSCGCCAGMCLALPCTMILIYAGLGFLCGFTFGKAIYKEDEKYNKYQCFECGCKISDKSKLCPTCIGVPTPSVLGTPIEVWPLEIAQHDFPGKMNKVDAINACRVLGDHWRLPTKDELFELNKNKARIGGFTDDYYWSSTKWSSTEESISYSERSWLQSFFDDKQECKANSFEFYVRAVRTI